MVGAEGLTTNLENVCEWKKIKKNWQKERGERDLLFLSSLKIRVHPLAVSDTLWQLLYVDDLILMIYLSILLSMYLSVFVHMYISIYNFNIYVMCVQIYACYVYVECRQQIWSKSSALRSELRCTTFCYKEIKLLSDD